MEKLFECRSLDLITTSTSNIFIVITHGIVVRPCVISWITPTFSNKTCYKSMMNITYSFYDFGIYTLILKINAAFITIVSSKNIPDKIWISFTNEIRTFFKCLKRWPSQNMFLCLLFINERRNF